MITGEQLKRYGWYFFGVMGVIFFWTGVWDGVGKLSYLKNPLVSLLLGLMMITLSKYIFKGADPMQEAEKSIEHTLHVAYNHPQKQDFHIKYHDKIQQKNILLRVDKIKEIEKGFLIVLDKGQKEFFIPIHRIREILHNGKTYKEPTT